MSKRILSTYDRHMLEIVELLTITKTDLTALRNIEFMPTGERRMLANIRRLIKLICKKLLALPMPPPQEPDLVELSNSIYDALLARQLGANTVKTTAETLEDLGLTRSLSQYLAGLAELFPQPEKPVDHTHDCNRDLHYWIQPEKDNVYLWRCSYCGIHWNTLTGEKFQPVDLPVSMGGDIPDGSFGS